MIVGKRQIIDSINGGATCRQCRYYRDQHKRNDVLFGSVSEKEWCTKFDHHIKDVSEGQDCLFFLKPIYSKKG